MLPHLTKLHLAALLLFVLCGKFVFGQFAGLQVGQSTGLNVQPGTQNFFLQVNVYPLPPAPSGTRDFDINGDGTNDIRFKMVVFGMNVDSLHNSIITLNGAEVRTYAQSQWVDSLMPGQPLLASDNWLSSQNHPLGEIPLVNMVRGNIPQGIDIESGTKNFGVRFPVQGQWFYAWIKYYSYGYAIHWGALVVEDYAWSGDPTAVGLLEGNANPTTLLSPNPSTGKFQLEFPPETMGEVAVVVTNVSGQTVFQQVVSGPSSSFDLSNLPKGLYHVQIESSTLLEHLTWVRM